MKARPIEIKNPISIVLRTELDGVVGLFVINKAKVVADGTLVLGGRWTADGERDDYWLIEGDTLDIDLKPKQAAIA